MRSSKFLTAFLILFAPLQVIAACEEYQELTNQEYTVSGFYYLNMQSDGNVDFSNIGPIRADIFDESLNKLYENIDDATISLTAGAYIIKIRNLGGSTRQF
jgi:hypothetical protein|tara:strand:- start:2139 stop:2441 length:303 start_codon:yes stop_codon:yes gene_type:complete